MVNHTVYFKGMMVFTLASHMYHRKSVLVPVLVRVPEYLSPSTSTSTSTMTLELTSTSTVRVTEIQYSSTASTSTEYEYPSPACRLFGASDYLNQCWNIVDWTLRKKLQSNINQNLNILIQENAVENVICEWQPFCLGINVFKFSDVCSGLNFRMNIAVTGLKDRASG